MITLTLKLPMILLIFFVLVPLIAYFDILMRGPRRGFWHYFWATFFEGMLVWMGYMLGVYL